jgi:hypothetical protein
MKGQIIASNTFQGLQKLPLFKYPTDFLTKTVSVSVSAHIANNRLFLFEQGTNHVEFYVSFVIGTHGNNTKFIS